MGKLVQNDGLTLFEKTIDNVAATIDFASIASGAGATSNDIAVPGAKLGDIVFVTASIDTQGLQVFGWVSAADTVKVRAVNNTGSGVDLASATYYIKVVRG